MKRALISAAAVGTTVFLFAAPAFADVIDGIWCSKEGRSLSIDGPNIITPAGNKITGNYNRHAFDYKVPASEPGAGSTVTMILVNEETVNLWMGSGLPEPASVQVWLRCKPVA
jgi:hypothetical protein